nr:MAG TPA: hypothetical protein [Caudoviricetes sp.]
MHLFLSGCISVENSFTKSISGVFNSTLLS